MFKIYLELDHMGMTEIGMADDLSGHVLRDLHTNLLFSHCHKGEGGSNVVRQSDRSVLSSADALLALQE